MVQWASFFWYYYSSIGINNKGSYKLNSNQTSKLIQDLYACMLIVSLGDRDFNSRRLTAMLTEKQKDIEMDNLYIMIFAFGKAQLYSSLLEPLSISSYDYVHSCK